MPTDEVELPEEERVIKARARRIRAARLAAIGRDDRTIINGYVAACARLSLVRSFRASVRRACVLTN
jgi:hypothetical protein